ncbi:hypothetical protein FRC10_009761 [Ceratobasidium sp. 414]|nr:hypothetical protein FRC10_009761 [Ceratobasidium sp. 414]
MPSSPNPVPVVAGSKQPAPKKSMDVSSDHPVKTVPTPTPQGRHQVTKKPIHAPEVQPSSSTGRPRRACAAQAAKVIQKQALESLDELEISEPEGTPEQPRRTATIQNPAGANDALPTPPDTRKAKPTGKILIPGSPAVAKPQLESPSSPISEILSPTAKVVSKRKRVEDDPIEPLVDVQEREAEKVQKGLPSSQHIAPRNTAATRAKAKYTTNAKKMRVSSPDPTGWTDDEERSPPARTNIPREPVRAGDGNSGSGEDVVEVRLLSKKNDSVARSTATFKKPNAFAKALHTTSEPGLSLRLPEVDHLIQGTSESASALLTGHQATLKSQDNHISEDETRQGASRGLGHAAKVPTPPESPLLSPSLDPPRKGLAGLKSVRDIEYIDVETISMVDVEVEADKEAPSSQGKLLEPLYSVIQMANVHPIGDDELLAALSRAAKKATRGLFPGSKAIQLRPMSPIGELSTSVAGQSVVDEHTAVAEIGVELGAPKSFEPVEKAQTKSMSPKVSPVRQPKSVKQEKALSEEQASPKVILNVSQAGKPSSKDTLLDSKDLVKEHARPLFNEQGDKTMQKATGLSKVSLDGYSMSRVQDVDTSEALESFGQSTNYGPNAAMGRIQGALVTGTAPTTRPPAETLPARRPASGASAILVDLADAGSEEDEPLETTAQLPVVKPVFRQTAQKAVFSNSIPARLRSQPEVALQAAAKIRLAHNAFERLVRSPRPGPKSALASPQKRILPRAGRPSVSFVDTPSPARRGSSDSSVTGRYRSEQRDARAEMLAGASARTGSAIMQIVEMLDAIQTTIVENLSGKVQTVTNDARNAREELTRTIVAKLGAVQAQAYVLLSTPIAQHSSVYYLQSEHHCNTLREFEGVFAGQTQEILDGCNRVDKSDAKINMQVQEVIAKNARAGQRIAKMAVDFELPEAVSTHLLPN